MHTISVYYKANTFTLSGVMFFISTPNGYCKSTIVLQNMLDTYNKSKGRYYKKKTLINTHVENSNTTNSITRFILNQFEHILLHRALVVQQFHVFLSLCNMK